MVTDNSVGITQLNVSDGTDAQALVTDGSGTLRFATVGAGGAVGSSTFIEDIRAGDGSTVTFSLSTAAPYEESIMVFIDGVAQPTSAYTLPSTTSITFSPAPANLAAIRICHLGIASSVANNAITGAKISMGGDVAGDVLYYNGTDYQRLGIGTASQHLATNAGATAPEWVTPSSTGDVVQMVYDSSTRQHAVQTTTATIPYDDTAPLIGEGTECMTVDITPASASNILVVRFNGVFAVTSSGIPICAIFSGSTCRGAATNGSHAANANEGQPIVITGTFVAGTTSALTISARFGNHGAGNTTTFNGASASRLYGDTPKASLVVTEFKP